MKLEKAKKIITNEDLHGINWYNEDNLRENQVGIKLKNGEWIVYVTDERASVVLGSVIKFNSEEEALEVLIRKARCGKEIFG